MVNFNQVGTYNGKFLSPNSALPICGVVLFDMYKNNLQQVYNNVSTQPLTWGLPVTIKTQQTTNPANAANAGKAFNPNVLVLEAIANSNNSLNGFVVKSVTDILMPQDEAPASRQSQISYVATFGSGIELYLPCEQTLMNVETSAIDKNNTFDYNFMDYTLKSGTAFSITLKSNVVDGIVTYYDSSTQSVKIKNTKCVKVRL